LIEGHRERYELCCKYRKDTPTLMAEYDAFLKRDEPSPQKRRPTTAPAALDQQPGGERKPSVKEIIRSSRAARAGKLKKGIEVQRGRAALTAASASASVPPIRHRRDVRPRRYRRDAVSVRSARRWRLDWCSLDAIDARGIRVARHLRDARRVARAGRRTRRPASNQKGGRSSSRGCWRGGCGPGDGGWNGARCALCGNQTMSWGILREPPHHLTERPRGQHRVDGVDLPRHRTDAATEAHRVDWWGARNLISTQVARVAQRQVALLARVHRHRHHLCGNQPVS